MTIRNFDELVINLRGKHSPKRVALIAADHPHSLEAVIMAEKDGCVSPILIGDSNKIKAVLQEFDWIPKDVCIVGVPDTEAAIQRAVALIHAGEADFLMKGRLDTAALMKVIVSRDNNLRTGRVMADFSFAEIPNYHKLIAISDVALNLTPDLAQKRQIIESCVEVLHKVGVSNPKVAIMSATEDVNPKLAESIDALALKEMNRSGDLAGCVVEGPISYDLAIDREAAEIKGFKSPVAGDADLLIMPGLTAGNMLIKSWTHTAGATSAGFVVGAKVPVVLVSRSSTTRSKYMSVILAASAC
jgi:phosphate butyryltransferase